MVGTEEADGTSDSYYVVAANSGRWEIIILMDFIEPSVGQLDLINWLAHFKVLFSLVQSAKSLR
jgi:hypothetical protein